MSRSLILDPDAAHDLDAIFDAIAADNPIAAELGIRTPVICTPEELMEIA